MLAGTDGLPPSFDIDSFNASRRSFTPYPTAIVQRSVSTHLVQEDIRAIGTTSPTGHVAVAALTYSLQESVRKVRKTTQT